VDAEARKAAFAAMRERMDEMQQYSEQSVAKVLTTAQQKRVLQIMLQIEGPLAVAKPDIAEQIGMTEEQLALVEEVMTGMRDAEREQRQQRRQAFGGPGGPGGPGGQGGPGGRRGGQNQDANGGAPQEKAKAADANAQAKGQGGQNGGRNNRQFQPPTPEQMKAFAENMKTSAVEQEKIRTEAITRISKILNKPQRDAFNKLLGKRLDDLTKLLPEGGGFGGFGRMPGGPGRGGPQNGNGNGNGGNGNGGPNAPRGTTKTAQN
jgi:hypothetical protein